MRNCMKTLIAEDSDTSRLLLQGLLKSYGPTHTGLNGKETVRVVRTALEEGEPYDLICLDIMMPEMDGQAQARPGGTGAHREASGPGPDERRDRARPEQYAGGGPRPGGTPPQPGEAA
jgi:hypothetical protein